MLTITEYLKGICEKFEEHRNEGTESMRGGKSGTDQLKNRDPRLKSDGSSLYSDLAFQQLYLLKYAYEYGFEYLSMCNEVIEDFADKEQISVVSLGCGTMLDYWALACTLDEREISRPVIKYHGIDAIKWDHSLGAEVRDKDKKTFKFSQESFKNFFERQDNRFNTYDIYFFPKSISEFSKNDMELMLNNLSEMEKNTIYFCISLRKAKKGVSNSDVKRVQDMMDKLEEEKTGFRVKEFKCMAATKTTVDQLKEQGLRVEVEKNDESIWSSKDGDPKRLDLIRLGAKKYIWETDVAQNVGGYPEIPEELLYYIEKLRKEQAIGKEEQAIRRTTYICDLIIKFERR